MGGIVGAETLRLLASEQLIPPPSNLSSSKSSVPDDKQPVELNMFMFPHIQGLLTFDTPFLGIAPGVVSYTAENHYKTAASTYGALSEVAGVFGWGGKQGSKSTNALTSPNKQPAAIESSAPSTPTTDAAATPSWQRWGRYAMYAGAAGAVAAGGAAALYSQRERFLAGWSWATSHLEFVGCLARPEELRRRVSALVDLQNERGIGCADFYTCLGKGAVTVSSDSDVKDASASFSRAILRSKLRTFCNLPDDTNSAGSGDGSSSRNSSGVRWIKAINDKAPDETKAHISMFSPKENPSFYDLSHRACSLLVEWVDKGWYATSDSSGSSSNRNCDHNNSRAENKKPGKRPGDSKEFMDADDVVLID